MKRVLVTGAAGFLGSSLSLELLRRGYVVLGVDNFNSFLYSKDIKESNWLALGKYPNFISIRDDFWNLDSNMLENLDVCFNFAALPGLIPGEEATEKYFQTNVLGTERFLKKLKNQRDLRFIHASTSSVYGERAVGAETEECLPVSSYGISKLASEHLIKAFCAKKDFSLCILRFFSVYGPRQRPDMAIHKLIICALEGKSFNVYGSLESVRTNTFVNDAVNALISFGDSPRLIGTYNIAGSERLSLNDWVISVENLVGSRIELKFDSPRDGDQRITHGDTSLARQAIGFSPKFSSLSGLKLQVDYIMKNRDIYSTSS